MKRVVIIALSFLCAIVCSCNKNEPQNLLKGTWEVSVILRWEMASFRDGVWHFTFGKGGKGEIVNVKDLDKSFVFKYKYHEGNNTITYELNGNPYVWEVDELTNYTFRFHSSNNVTEDLLGYATRDDMEVIFDGKKIE